MKKNPHAPLAYRRETYRLWFEYLRLAHLSNDDITRNALKGSRLFYDAWGDVMNIKFDDWWKTHAGLFEERRIHRLEPGSSVNSSPEVVTIEVPLALSSSEIMSDVRAIIHDALSARKRDHRKDTRRPSAAYRPTLGAEPKLKALYDTLIIYRDVYLPHRHLRGKKLLAEVIDFYQKPRARKARRLPDALQTTSHETETRVLRNLNRYIGRAKKIILNVARGEFPGEY